MISKMWRSTVKGRREGGRGGGELPQVLGAPRNFLLGPKEIFPRKGQDIWFFGQSNEIWYEKLR
jgi:hypothetical protein